MPVHERITLTSMAMAGCLAMAAADVSALPTAFAGTDLSQIVASHYGTDYRSFSTEMLGLNNLGQVLGHTQTRDGLDRTFLIANGALSEIGAFDTSRGTGSGIYGRGLNNQGDVVGEIFVAGTGAQRLRAPALYSAGTVTQLNIPFSNGYATAISDSGHIAGTRSTPGTQQGANFVLRSDGSYTEFLPGQTGVITGITSTGSVVGWGYSGGAGTLGWIFNGSSVTYPLQPTGDQDAPGRFDVVFSAVNDAGQIATTYRYFNGQNCYCGEFGVDCFDSFNKEAGVLQAGVFAPAPDLTVSPQTSAPFTAARASGINNRGTLIGFDEFRQSAFLSDGTTTVTLYDPRRIGASNFTGEIFDINDADQLLGRRGNSGNSPWVLLNPVGVNPQAPLLPAEQTPTADGGAVFTFTVFAAPATPLFIDPPVAVGYEYEVQSGPSFASVLLPDVGDGRYRLELWSGSAWIDAGVDLEAGVSFDFLATVAPDGLRKFRIVGIETTVALDPNDPNAFVTGLTFTSGGELRLTQTSLTVDVPAVPEPATGVLLLAGLWLVGHMARQRVGARVEAG